MRKTLNNLKDLAETTDNYYLLRQLELLESKINIELMNAQIQVYKKVNKCNS